MSADETFDKITKEMFDKFLEKNPDYATQIGLHEPYDYLLPKGSSEQLEEMLQLLQETKKRLKEALNREELNDQHKIDWDVIEKACEQWEFALHEQRTHELDPDAFSLLGGLVFIMFTRNYAPLEKRVDAIAARIEKTPKFLEEFRTRFENKRPVKLWTEIAIETAQSMAGLFHYVLQASKDRVQAVTHERLAKAVENLQPALKKHIEWLHALVPNTREEWALGREKFEKLVELRELGMTSEEICELGMKYLKELRVERDGLARQIAPEKKTAEVLGMIQAYAPKTFDEALELTRKTMEEARRFVQEKNIAKVYSEDVLLVEETPGFIAPVIPFAAMVMPAKFDKPQIGIYVVTRPKDMANLGKHLNYASVRNTAVHEAFPGHFLQGATSNRGSVFPLLVQGSETIEGWAHYCEQLMVERGFMNDPKSRLVQVNDMIWRAVRIIVDVKLSRGEMSFEDAVTMLVQETGMSREGAEAEVKRYTQTPGYPLSYLLGKHLILQLREELKRRMGTKFNERFFHDTITANGYLPFSLLRKVFEQKIK